jgi:hypothetical protein
MKIYGFRGLKLDDTIPIFYLTTIYSVSGMSVCIHCIVDTL